MVWSIVFLLIALLAGGLALAGISGTALYAASGLCLLALGIAGGLFYLKRRPAAAKPA